MLGWAADRSGFQWTRATSRIHSRLLPTAIAFHQHPIKRPQSLAYDIRVNTFWQFPIVAARVEARPLQAVALVARVVDFGDVAQLCVGDEVGDRVGGEVYVERCGITRFARKRPRLDRTE